MGEIWTPIRSERLLDCLWTPRGNRRISLPLRSTRRPRVFHLARWNFRGRDRYGGLLWEDLGIPNINPDVGEQFIVQVVFSEQDTVPAAYHIGLTKQVGANINEQTTLATATNGTDGTEPSGNGYARQPVNSDATDFTTSQVGGNWRAKTKTVTFTASGGPIPATGTVDFGFLGKPLTGTAGALISIVALSQARTIAAGDSLDVDMTITISE